MSLNFVALLLPNHKMLFCRFLQTILDRIKSIPIGLITGKFDSPLLLTRIKIPIVQMRFY